MTLIERAQEFISRPAPRELEHLLHDCISAESIEGLIAVQLLAEGMYDGMTYNFEIKCPAAWCLVAWQERGLEAIVEMSLRTHTLKNYSIAFQILGTLSSQQRFSNLWPTASLRRLIESRVTSWEETFDAARTQLNVLALSIPSDDDAALYTADSMQSLYLTAPDAVKSLFLAVCARWLSVGPSTLSEYENLLINRPADESAFHRFFEGHIQLLDPMALDAWSKPRLHGAAEPDFVIRRIDGTYLVVEIETPSKTLVTNDGQLNAQTTRAITQALHYREFLVCRSTEASTTFPQFQTPDCLVVIGLEQRLNAKQRRTLSLENRIRAGLHIVGFDWLAERARTLARNLVEGRIDVRRVRMT